MPTYRSAENGAIGVITYIDSNNIEQTHTINNPVGGRSFHKILLKFLMNLEISARLYMRPIDTYFFHSIIKFETILDSGDRYIYNIIKSRYISAVNEDRIQTTDFETYFDTVTKSVTVSHIVSSLYNIKTIITDNPANIRFSIFNMPLFAPENSGDFPIPLNVGTTEGNYSG